MPAGRRIFIAPPALGMGDLIVTLPVVQSMIKAGNAVFLIARAESHLQLIKHIDGLAGTLLEWDFDKRGLLPGDAYYDMRSHPLQQNYWWGSDDFERAYPGYRINEILSHICRDLGIQADLAKLQPLMAAPIAYLNDTILFIPGSAFSFKCWSTQNWLALKQLAPSPVAMIGEPDNSQSVQDLRQAGLDWIETPTLTDAINVVSSVKAVVAVDTGLMHLSVNQKTPTVALYRHNPVYLRDYSHVQHVIAARACATACFTQEKQCAHHTRPEAGPGFTPLDWDCVSTDYRCMDSLSVKQVSAALNAVLSPTPATKVMSQVDPTTSLAD